ncbi:MAG: hypothetical protein RLZZ605_667 [Bacteroidota bacterium]|jgi:hypothetical protein
MKLADLKQGEVYKNITDLDIPLKFTGKTENVSKEVKIIRAHFEPVKTSKNKNWFNTKPTYIFNFYGNEPENTVIGK